jgi:homocysteine S-methyltransferase
MTWWTDIFSGEPVVLDGGLSTQLERRGRDISGSLWTGRALLADPADVTSAHADYVRAGADVVITSSYQISRSGFEAAGLGREAADAALVASTAAAREAVVGSGARVAASVGPYGAILHDGSEYRGRYGLSRTELIDFHRERLDVLAATAPDLLAVETIPDVDEAEAIAEVLADHPGLPAWMCFSAVDAGHTCAGQPIEDAVAAATAASNVVAVGVNCTDPQHVAGLISRMRAVTDLPIVVYPNAGGAWDPTDGQWHDAGPAGFAPEIVAAWLAAGATAIGGCCGTDERTISALAAQLGGPAG